MKALKFIVEKTDTGLSAFAEDFATLPVASTGADTSELRKNVTDAVNLYRLDKKLKPIKKTDILLALDLQQVFEYYSELNAKGLSRRVGMNQTLLSQYVTGTKKASPKQVHKIFEGIRALGEELTQLAAIC